MYKGAAPKKVLTAPLLCEYLDERFYWNGCEHSNQTN